MASSSNTEQAPSNIMNLAPSRSDFPLRKSKEYTHDMSLRDWQSTSQKLTLLLEVAMSALAGVND